ncbi:phage GP46 family protein [Paraburkholderia susongensis]|uniref:Phage protein GP46 n=1 Tax=Paraburkholderia susongensis TaxID=1515439 RepID=A0A1X7I4C9_9BURK|nr:phage GP46 family protein [Paraburkholderia susongensis]SMG09283.1 Phage protein GP46 [Paraburkholderia susongensis]
MTVISGAVLTTRERETLYRRAVVISLFSWRRALPSDVLDDDERMGWWGDSYPLRDNDRTGSRLWLLRRRSITSQTLADARQYALEALQWLRDDRMVSSLAVDVARNGLHAVRLTVTLDEHSDAPLRFEWDDIWRTIGRTIHAV